MVHTLAAAPFEEPGVGGSRSELGYPAPESEAFTAHGGLSRLTTVGCARAHGQLLTQSSSRSRRDLASLLEPDDYLVGQLLGRSRG
jgi:hypothetical protein